MIEAFAPDILLVQETRHPSHYLASDVYAANANRIHWRPARDGKWGSAIFARSGKLKPLRLPKYEGYVVAAEITGSDWSKRRAGPARLQPACAAVQTADE
jgi:exonuclease III